MRKPTCLALHGLFLLALLALAGALATLRGALFPFDIRATALMTVSGLAGLAQVWAPVWPMLVALAAALPRIGQRLAAWPVALGAMVLAHLALGPGRGLAPLALLGVPAVAGLYLVPVGLALTLGSALREALRGGLRRA